MPVKRRRSKRRDRAEEQRQLMLRYFRGEALTHAEKLHALTPTAQPRGLTIEEWREELAGEIGPPGR